MLDLTPYTTNRQIRLRFLKLIDFCDHSKACDKCCWQWKGYLYKGFRARFYIGFYDNKALKAHASRFMWALRYGNTDLQVNHTCDNPVCVNYNHLYAGTQQQNMQDRKERNRAPKGEGHSMSKLSTEDVIEIFILRKEGYLQREIAELFSVTPSNISSILRGNSWQHFRGE